MNEHKIGALMVTHDDNEGQIAGIFTERDVLRRVVADGHSPAEVHVAQVMTQEVMCCSPNTDIDEASRIMRDCRVRHLPVCDGDGQILGLISIGDLNAYHASDTEATIQFLNEYIHGRV
jgi:CBS domain-containing protein